MTAADRLPDEPMTLDNAPDFLTVLEVAQLLRIGRDAAYAAVRNGTVPSVQCGRLLRIPKQALLDQIQGDDR